MHRILSWHLWQSLRFPPEHHPVFQRWSGATRGTRRLTRVVESLAPVTMGSGLLICAAMWFLPHIVLFPQIFMLWGVTPFVFVLLNSTLFGALWAGMIGKTIADAYITKRYELLTLSPTGALMTHWAIGTACLHRNELFRQVYFQRNSVIYQLMIPLALLFVIGYVITQPQQYDLHLELIVLYSSGIIAFFFDFIYSTVLGSLCGMLLPRYTSNSLNSGIWSLLGFLVVQGLSYGLILTIDLLLLPALYNTFNVSGPAASVTITLLRLLVFLVIREGGTQLIWSLLLRAVEADGLEKHLVFARR